MLCSCHSGILPNLEPYEDCINDYLNEYNLKAYSEEEIPCGKSYLVLYRNENTVYVIPHNDCADLLPRMLVDCDGNELCVYVTEEGCFEMVQNSTRIGIIGVAK
jgi:hypothetical protein